MVLSRTLDNEYFEAGQAVSGEMLWGRVLTFLRKNGPQNLYALCSQVNTADFASGTLSIKVNDVDYDSFMSYKDRLSAVLTTINSEVKLNIMVLENLEQTQILQEVNKIKQLLSGFDLKIIN